MADMEKVLHYNRELHDRLALLFGELNHGQQQKVLKNQEVKALLLRYHVIEEDNKNERH